MSKHFVVSILRQAFWPSKIPSNKQMVFDFLSGTKKDTLGRNITDIWDYSDWDLEHVHNYIQWIFPLDAPSDHNSKAPIITSTDVECLDPASFLSIQENMIQSLTVMLRFYGFSLTVPYGKPVIRKMMDFKEKKENWCVMYNHNHLRITRILKSLKLFHLDSYANTFYDALLKAAHIESFYPCNEPEDIINASTLSFWRDAVN